MSVSSLELENVIGVLKKNLSQDFLKDLDRSSFLSLNICQNRDKMSACLEKLKVLQVKFKETLESDSKSLQEIHEAYENEIKQIEQFLIEELNIIKTEAQKKLMVFNKVTGFSLENEADLKPKDGVEDSLDALGSLKSRRYITLPSNIQNWLVLITAVDTRMTLLKTADENRTAYAKKRDTLINDTLYHYLHSLIENLCDSSSARRTSGSKALLEAGIEGTEHWGDSAPPSIAPSRRASAAHRASPDSGILKLHTEVHDTDSPSSKNKKATLPSKGLPKPEKLSISKDRKLEDPGVLTHLVITSGKDSLKEKTHFSKAERDIAVLYGAAIPSDSSTAPTPRNVSTPLGADWEKQLAEALEKNLNSSLSGAAGSISDSRAESGSRNSISVSVRSSRHNSISVSGLSSKRSSISVSISACPSVRNRNGRPQYFRFSICAPNMPNPNPSPSYDVLDIPSKSPSAIPRGVPRGVPSAMPSDMFSDEFDGEFSSDLENIAVDLELDQDTESDIEAALDAIPDFTCDVDKHSPFADAISKEVLNRLRTATLSARKQSEKTKAEFAEDGIELAQLVVNPRGPEVLHYRKLHNRSESDSNSEPSSPVHSLLPGEAVLDSATGTIPALIPALNPNLFSERLSVASEPSARKKTWERRKSF